MKRLGVLVLGMVMLFPAQTAWSAFSQDLRMEPQPFRLDQVREGREFDYNAESFIHRASFAPNRPIAPDAVSRDRIVGTGGSTRSDELFLDMAVQTTYEFTDKAFFQYRFRRTEDFDGRYDRSLIGLGTRPLDTVEARLMADVNGDKSAVDVQPEITWRASPSLTVNAALVFTDMLFNDKQNRDEYIDSARTAFIAAHWQINDAHHLRSYANVTPRTTVDIHEEETERFRDQNARGGLAWDWHLAPGQHWRWLAEAEGTDRDSRLDGEERQNMTRRFWRSRMEYRRVGLERWDLRLGGQFLFLRERGAFIGDAVELTDRQEVMAFIGTGRQLSSTWRVDPTVYAVNVEGDSLGRDGENEIEEDDLNGNFAKVTLPFTWLPDGADGARVTLNPTFRLHTAAFGGGNLNISIPL